METSNDSGVACHVYTRDRTACVELVYIMGPAEMCGIGP